MTTVGWDHNEPCHHRSVLLKQYNILHMKMQFLIITFEKNLVLGANFAYLQIG